LISKMRFDGAASMTAPVESTDRRGFFPIERFAPLY